MEYAFNQNSKFPERRPVVFLVVCQNYFRFNGIRMNNEAYSSYPHEKEVLLTEGCDIYVMQVERDVRLEETHESFKEYEQRSVDLIYCFH